MIGIKKLLMEFAFFVAKDSCLGKTVELCQDKVGMSCFRKKSVRYSRSIDKKQMPQSFRGALGNIPDSQLCLSFLVSFGGCLLALPEYSVNIIFLLRSLMGLKPTWSQLQSSHILTKSISGMRLRFCRVGQLSE